MQSLLVSCKKYKILLGGDVSFLIDNCSVGFWAANNCKEILLGMNASLLNLAALIIAILALTTAIMAWLSLRSFNRLRQTFFAGRDGGDLEQVINTLTDSLKQLTHQQSALEQDLQKLQNNFRLSVQKVGVVRFNPFADGGGNFSFSIALLDGRGTGLVITSMHGREQNRIYSKKILGGKSESQLTEEEQQAITLADEAYLKQIS